MRAVVLSATEHDYYAMPLPFAIFSWAQLGFNSITFIPNGKNPKLELAKKYSSGSFYGFNCEEKRIPTYSQVVRLFGAALPHWNKNDILVTGDSDMCVFSDYFERLADGGVNICGNDLTPQDQYPMCYCGMPVKMWRHIFKIDKSYQEHVAELIDPIEGDNIRGEQWCYDQWYLKKKIKQSGENIMIYPRSNGQNQFAAKRADRDGWHFNPYDIIDAHLPRPLTDEENFNKVYDLFKIKYPTHDLNWMTEYYNEYKQLL